MTQSVPRVGFWAGSGLSGSEKEAGESGHRQPIPLLHCCRLRLCENVAF